MTYSLTDERIEQLFREFIPEDVTIEFVENRPFVDFARRHPYIQLQMRFGIYNEMNIYTDFLSPARVHATDREQMICSEIINRLIDGITPTIAEDYVRYIAAHEAHHFHGHTKPSTASQHAVTELECVQQLNKAHPELAEASRYVEKNSPVYQRVFDRMDKIKTAAKKARSK